MTKFKGQPTTSPTTHLTHQKTLVASDGRALRTRWCTAASAWAWGAAASAPARRPTCCTSPSRPSIHRRLAVSGRGIWELPVGCFPVVALSLFFFFFFVGGAPKRREAIAFFGLLLGPVGNCRGKKKGVDDSHGYRCHEDISRNRPGTGNPRAGFSARAHARCRSSVRNTRRRPG